MKNKYQDLIEQSHLFPQEGFSVQNAQLSFNGISLDTLIEKYGTPFRLTYLPQIPIQIQKAKSWFQKAMEKNEYEGSYYYCYCTKCCHLAPIVKKVVEESVHLETSSGMDIDILLSIFSKGLINKSTVVIHNGYKTQDYVQKIKQLQDLGFENSIIILDNKAEINHYKLWNRTVKIGIRMATELRPNSDYYTSRLGIRLSEIEEFYKKEIRQNDNIKLEILHFFVDSGIEDNLHYWGEFQKALSVYASLKQHCVELIALNLGGGFPIRNNLSFTYDYEYMCAEMIRRIAEMCMEEDIPHPDIFTEFGKFTVGESSAVIFSVLDSKAQNDNEQWYIIDNSLLNTIPDAWAMLEKFILLPVNHWDQPYQRVNIGGISCDQSDYYNAEELNQQIFLPKIDANSDSNLHVGFFHTGAYQDAVSGYGGAKHCLIPSPKHIMIDEDENGEIVTTLFRKEQNIHEVLDILGY